MKTVRIGVIGVGGIANGVHIPGYRQTEICEIVAICDINAERLEKVGEKLGIPKSHRFADYRDLIACADVDAVDIATWNSVHCEIAAAAVAAGKPVSVEKPVGLNYTEAWKLAEAAEKNQVPTFVCLSWRYRPHTRYLKYLLDNKKLGKLYHIYVRCIKDSGLWKGRKREWRFDSVRAGSGVLGDLGSHMIDIVRFFGEEFKEVYAQKGIFVKERPSEEDGAILSVDTDDWCNIVAKMESDVACTIQLSRCATTVPDITQFEIYGEKGKLVFLSENGKFTITFTDAETKAEEILEVPTEFDAVQSRSFVNLVNGIEDEYTCKIEQGLACQAVIDAALLSAEQNRTVSIVEIKEGAR